MLLCFTVCWLNVVDNGARGGTLNGLACTLLVVSTHRVGLFTACRTGRRYRFSGVFERGSTVSCPPLLVPLLPIAKELRMKGRAQER